MKVEVLYPSLNFALSNPGELFDVGREREVHAHEIEENYIVVATMEHEVPLDKIEVAEAIFATLNGAGEAYSFLWDRLREAFQKENKPAYTSMSTGCMVRFAGKEVLYCSNVGWQRYTPA